MYYMRLQGSHKLNKLIIIETKNSFELSILKCLFTLFSKVHPSQLTANLHFVAYASLWHNDTQPYEPLGITHKNNIFAFDNCDVCDEKIATGVHSAVNRQLCNRRRWVHKAMRIKIHGSLLYSHFLAARFAWRWDLSKFLNQYMNLRNRRHLVSPCLFLQYFE